MEYFSTSRIKLTNHFDAFELLKLLNTGMKNSYLQKLGGVSSVAKEIAEFIENPQSEISLASYQTLIYDIFTGIADYNFAQVVCDLYKADEAILDYNFYKSLIETESNNTIRSLNLDEEKAAARALFFPEFNWINTMNMNDIIQFRENDGCEMLRNIFREEHKSIKYAKIDDFENIVKRTKDHLDCAIQEHENLLKSKDSSYTKALRNASLSLGATLSLSIISVAVPPLLIITLPISAFSFIKGSKSLIDVLNLALSGKKDINGIRKRPIGILAKYCGK